MKPFCILVADRNPHVREFIRRELTAEGCRVVLAESGLQTIKLAYHEDPPDLVIIDPDLPDMEKATVIRKLENRIPKLPMVVHAFASGSDDGLDAAGIRVFVEKHGASIEILKSIVRERIAAQAKAFDE